MSGQVNLDRWYPHLAAAKREGKTLSEYAREKGVSAHTLYAARQMLRRLEGEPKLLPKPRVARKTRLLAPAAFAAVTLAQPSVVRGDSAAQLRIQLPSGARLELMSVDAALLGAAIAALKGQ
jgi:hypothetical protein